MESLKSLTINHDPATGNYSCLVPVAICDNLLLSHESDKGILLHSKQKEKLEKLVVQIITLNTDALSLKEKGKSAQLRKLAPAMVILIALVIGVFFTEPFFKNNPSLRLPISISGAAIAVYCCFILFKNYSMPGLYDQGTDTLRHRLALTALHKQIDQNF
jgi:hypothetical protein